MPSLGGSLGVQGGREGDGENFTGRRDVADVDDRLADPLHYLIIGDVGNRAVERGLGSHLDW